MIGLSGAHVLTDELTLNLPVLVPSELHVLVGLWDVCLHRGVRTPSPLTAGTKACKPTAY